jgi:tyramine---L-glutamate ligase
MRVFVYEYTCATAPDSALRGEGQAMLAAVLADLARVPGVQTVTLLHPSCPRPPHGGSVRQLDAGGEETAVRELAAAADGSLVIAPEFDDILWCRCRWVEEAGGRLLGPSSEAVALTADKLRLGEQLLGHGVPTPPCRLATPGLPPAGYPLVCKPRHGAGSQATFLVHSEAELTARLTEARGDGWSGEAIVQPFVPGQPTSVAFLLGPRQRLPLKPARQHLSADGRFRYQGGSLPLPLPLAGRAVRLAERAVAAVPGLRGYVGVDLVLGEDGRDWVIEINSRLTTSYVGLRELAQDNLAEVMLRVVAGEWIDPLRWREGEVHFVAADL